MYNENEVRTYEIRVSVYWYAVYLGDLGIWGRVNKILGEWGNNSSRTKFGVKSEGWRETAKKPGRWFRGIVDGAEA